jgi:hypothetical protein
MFGAEASATRGNHRNCKGFRKPSLRRAAPPRIGASGGQNQARMV